VTRLRLLRSTFLLAVYAALAGASAACVGSTSPTAGAPFSQTDLRLGTGATAASGNTLSVNYTGWLYDPSKADLKGLQFDTTVGTTAFSFSLGANQVIAGWDQGLVGMRIGGLRRLVVPPSLAYGTSRSGAIPANATLVFDIELLTVQ
jgi:FKBP-type peptidyl-prolyl cis-trans isomerase FkpA